MPKNSTWKNYLAGMVKRFQSLSFLLEHGSVHPTNLQQRSRRIPQNSESPVTAYDLPESDADNIASYWQTTGDLLRRSLAQVQREQRQKKQEK